KSGAPHVPGAPAWIEPSANFGNQMLHRFVGFDPAQFGDPHRARSANAREIVSQQIDDHQVLGPILLAFAKLVAREEIGLRTGSPPAGPLDRPGIDLAISDTHEPLGRCTGDGPVVSGEVAGEWSRVPLAKSQVKLERIAIERPEQPLREVHLKNIPRIN